VVINVICLKHGTKYGPSYVNNLYNMVQRHLTLPHRFVCFTEDPTDLHSKIEVLNLPTTNAYSGWWWKPYAFKKDHFPDNDINFFIDLDMVIINNIDKLMLHDPGSFLGLEDPGRVWNIRNRLGSAVMRWPSGTYSDIWEDLNPEIMKRFRGDQDWIFHLHKKSIKFYPEKWIMSYKWEIRKRQELTGSGQSSRFKDIKNPEISNETSILAFHGFPQPHQVEDPIVVNNWC
jgi:hypothetical protein